MCLREHNQNSNQPPFYSIKQTYISMPMTKVIRKKRRRNRCHGLSTITVSFILSYPTCPSMGISTRRSGLPMPIESSNRLFGVPFSDGSRTRRWVISTGHFERHLKIPTTLFRWIHTNRNRIIHRRVLDLSEMSF